MMSEDSGRTAAEKAEIDSRSIFVGNVDYSCKAEDVRQHFEDCGTVNWVTILTDAYCQPRGCAFVEFVEAEGVQNALLLNESELRGRKLKVAPKRTNIPGMSRRQWLGFRRPPPPPHDDGGYGRAPRIGRPIVRYEPY